LFSPEKNLIPAKNLLSAKLYNQKRLLQRLATNRELSPHPNCSTIEKLRKRLARQQTLDQLKGIEGLAAHYYFETLKDYLPEWCNFSGRNRKPALDPVNALLSYSYAIMTGEIENLIRLHALDPAFGFLHCSNYNTSSLAFDLMEPFRPGFCDMLAISLITHKHLRKEHFIYSTDYVALSYEGKKIFFKAWETKRNRKLQYQEKTVNWQDIWDQQVMNWLTFLTERTIPKFFKLH
jgi:CRISPR-associated protein Cas1